MQPPYTQRFRSSCKIRLMLRVDTLISTGIRFYLCSSFCLTRSQTVWITFDRCMECGRLSLDPWTMSPFSLYRLTMWKTNRRLILIDFGRITISLCSPRKWGQKREIMWHNWDRCFFLMFSEWPLNRYSSKSWACRPLHISPLEFIASK